MLLERKLFVVLNIIYIFLRPRKTHQHFTSVGSWLGLQESRSSSKAIIEIKTAKSYFMAFKGIESNLIINYIMVPYGEQQQH